MSLVAAKIKMLGNIYSGGVLENIADINVFALCICGLVLFLYYIDYKYLLALSQLRVAESNIHYQQTFISPFQIKKCSVIFILSFLFNVWQVFDAVLHSIHFFLSFRL